jgi:hypothetical protein
MNKNVFLILCCTFKISFGQTIDTKASIIKRLVEKTPQDILGVEEICNIQYSFLGDIVLTNRTIYKVSTLSLDFGQSCRNTTRIILYNGKYQYLGNYYTEGSLPNNIDKNKLTGINFPTLDLSNGISDSILISTTQYSKFDTQK